jgi:NADH-quinone oxidoreductase subunit G
VKNKPKEKTAAMRIPEWDNNAVRNAIQDETGPLYLATITSTRLDAIATRTFHLPPDDIARLGFAIAHELAPDAPCVPDLRDAVRKQSQEIARALKNAKRPLIISGTSPGSDSVIQAAANIAWALCKGDNPAELCYVVPECNSLGAGLLGGKNINELLPPSPHAGEGRGEGKAKDKADTIIILENDLHRRAETKIVDDFLNRTKNVIIIDHLINPTSSRGNVTFPAATFAESSGTLLNNEGRAQRFYQVYVPQGDIQASWKWINDIMKATGKSVTDRWPSLDDLINDMASALPIFYPVKDVAPTADFRIIGQKVSRQPHRYSGRTAMLANISLHEPKPPEDEDSPLSFSMEGYQEEPPAPLVPRYWSPGWNSVQALNKFQQEVGGRLKGVDPGKRLIEPITLPSSLPSREGQQHPLPESNISSPLVGEDKGEGDKDVRGDSSTINFFQDIPEAFKPKDGEQIDILFQNNFGSEELSGYSPSIVERAKLINQAKRKIP